MPRIRCALILIAVLAACSDEVGRLSIEEGFKCANLGFEGHPGTFSQRGSAIGYSYENSERDSEGRRDVRQTSQAY